MSKKPETIFRENKVIPFLKTLKHTAYFPIQQKAIRGDPDFILCINGLFVGLELKKDEATQPDALQKSKHRYIRDDGGGFVIVAHPENWDVCAKFLSTLDRGGKKAVEAYLRLNEDKEKEEWH